MIYFRQSQQDIVAALEKKIRIELQVERLYCVRDRKTADITNKEKNKSICNGKFKINTLVVPN